MSYKLSDRHNQKINWLTEKKLSLFDIFQKTSWILIFFGTLSYLTSCHDLRNSHSYSKNGNIPLFDQEIKIISNDQDSSKLIGPIKVTKENQIFNICFSIINCSEKLYSTETYAESVEGLKLGWEWSEITGEVLYENKESIYKFSGELFEELTDSSSEAVVRYNHDVTLNDIGSYFIKFTQNSNLDGEDSPSFFIEISQMKFSDAPFKIYYIALFLFYLALKLPKFISNPRREVGWTTSFAVYMVSTQFSPLFWIAVLLAIYRFFNEDFSCISTRIYYLFRLLTYPFKLLTIIFDILYYFFKALGLLLKAIILFFNMIGSILINLILEGKQFKQYKLSDFKNLVKGFQYQIKSIIFNKCTKYQSFYNNKSLVNDIKKTILVFLSILILLTTIYSSLFLLASKGYGTVGYKGNYSSNQSIFNHKEKPFIN